MGIAALARLLAARHARVETPALPPVAPGQDPAAELRRKLAESRHEPATAEVVGAPAARSEPLEARRARVHAKAQEALDAMDALQEPPA